MHLTVAWEDEAAFENHLRLPEQKGWANLKEPYGADNPPKRFVLWHFGKEFSRCGPVKELLLLEKTRWLSATNAPFQRSLALPGPLSGR